MALFFIDIGLRSIQSLYDKFNFETVTLGAKE